ncbi:MAG: NUDIX domain-containing protein [Calditrichaeota bacterium]|nr:MAG: NUDIX domain-containing protein [Calditrichota bacterium]MBL1204318.1 NUDIX domain-containing protein [Calditrichota bacterium]NOG44148.1 NUDIX hydrolase [Calditrichota bacterium]
MLNKHFPQVAVGAIIFKDEKILLVKRANAPAKGVWAVPGGKIKPGESMKNALKREILEETNLEIEVGEAVLVFDVIEYGENAELLFHYVIIDFECTVTGGSIKAGDDAADVRWVSEEEVGELKMSEKTKELLKNKYSFGL